MLRGIVVLITVGICIYALVDCLRSPGDEVKALPKPLWVVLILLAPLLGGIAYLVFGRGGTSSGPGGTRQPRVVAPDDDPDFLRSLDRGPEPGPRAPDGGGAAGPRADGTGGPGDADEPDQGRRGEKDGEDNSDHPTR